MRRRSAARAIWLGLAALVAVTVLLAPVVSGGWCNDAVEPQNSVCGTFTRSIVGIDTTGWSWLFAVLVVAVITTTAAISARRRS